MCCKLTVAAMTFTSDRRKCFGYLAGCVGAPVSAAAAPLDGGRSHQVGTETNATHCLSHVAEISDLPVLPARRNSTEPRIRLCDNQPPASSRLSTPVA